MGLTRRSTCRTCGTPFTSAKGKSQHFRTRDCKRLANTVHQREYATNNRIHLREYVRERRIRAWGESGPETAARAERIAMERILPRLGLTDFYHASAVNRFVPFDILATYHGCRVLIDVTTGVSTGTAAGYQQAFAQAQGMSIYVRFVRPDMTKYQLKLWDGSRKSAYVHLAELMTVE